jgi:serine/threonine protein kinase
MQQKASIVNDSLEGGVEASLRGYARIIGANAVLSHAIGEYEQAFDVPALVQPMPQPERVDHLVEWRDKKLPNGAFGQVRLVDVVTNQNRPVIAVAKANPNNLAIIAHEAGIFEYMRERMPRHHANIIGFLGFFDIEGSAHVLTDAADLDLYDFLEIVRKNQEFRGQRVVPSYMYLELAHAVAALHAIGVVHGDLKENNVVVNLRGRKPKLQLIDFGLAQIADRFRCVDVKGCTISYAPPEQIIYVKKIKTKTPVHVTAKADIWSLAAVFFCMATLNKYVTYDPKCVSNCLKNKAGVTIDAGIDIYRSRITTTIKMANNLLPDQAVPAILPFLLLSKAPGFAGGALRLTGKVPPMAGGFQRTLSQMWSINPAERPTARTICKRLQMQISRVAHASSR